MADLLAAIFAPGGPRAAAEGWIARGLCIRCEKAPVIRTHLELAEYRISALCGPCWDSIFANDDEGA